MFTNKKQTFILRENPFGNNTHDEYVTRPPARG
jgi:hypothetical protein